MSNEIVKSSVFYETKVVILAEIKSEKGKIHMGGRKLTRRRKKIKQKGKLKNI